MTYCFITQSFCLYSYKVLIFFLLKPCPHFPAGTLLCNIGYAMLCYPLSNLSTVISYLSTITFFYLGQQNHSCFIDSDLHEIILVVVSGRANFLSHKFLRNIVPHLLLKLWTSSWNPGFHFDLIISLCLWYLLDGKEVVCHVYMVCSVFLKECNERIISKQMKQLIHQKEHRSPGL